MGPNRFEKQNIPTIVRCIIPTIWMDAVCKAHISEFMHTGTCKNSATLSHPSPSLKSRKTQPATSSLAFIPLEDTCLPFSLWLSLCVSKNDASLFQPSDPIHRRLAPLGELRKTCAVQNRRTKFRNFPSSGWQRRRRQTGQKTWILFHCVSVSVCFFPEHTASAHCVHLSRNIWMGFITANQMSLWLEYRRC